MSGYAQGYLDYAYNQPQLQAQQLQNQIRMKQLQDYMRQQQIRQQLGGVLMGMAGDDQTQMMPQSPPPGASSPPMNPSQTRPALPAPGNAMPGQGWQKSPMAGGAPPGQPPGMAPGQTFIPAGGGPQPQGQPQAQPQPEADGITQPRQFDLRGIMQTLKKQGVPADEVMDMLDQLSPIMSAQNKTELETAKLQLNWYKDVAKYATDSWARTTADKRAEDTAQHQQNEEKHWQRQDAVAAERAQTMKDRAKTYAESVVGKGNVKGQPKDLFDDQYNYSGYKVETKNGLYLYMDLEGNQVPANKYHTAEELKLKGNMKPYKTLSAINQRINAINNQLLTDPNNQDLKGELADLNEQAKGMTGSLTSGSGDIGAQVKAAGVPYEPEKYDYRIVNGQVQRKPRGE